MNYLRYTGLFLVALLSMTGCGSGRKTLEGYDESMLKGKRIAVVVPMREDYLFTNEAGYAYSRGVGITSAREQIENETRAWLASTLAERIKTNTWITYQNDPTSKIIPLSIKEDFGEKRNWEKIKQAASEGKFDYILVVKRYQVINLMSREASMGEEQIECSCDLLDPQRGKLMVGVDVKLSVHEPRSPKMSYDRLADELVNHLPFTNQ